MIKTRNGAGNLSDGKNVSTMLSEHLSFIESETERRIVVALVECIKKKPLAKITVADLVKEANISRSTFYRTTYGISELVEELENDILEHLRDLARYMVSGGIRLENLDVPEQNLLGLLTFTYNIRELYVALNSENGDPQYQEKEKALVKEMYGSNITYHNLGRAEMDVYFTFILSGHEAVLNYWLKERPDISPEQMTVILQHLIYGIYK